MKQRGISGSRRSRDGCDKAESRRAVGRQTLVFRRRSRMLRQLGRNPGACPDSGLAFWGYPPPNSAAVVRSARVACGGGATLTTVGGAAAAAVAVAGAGANSCEAVAVVAEAVRALALGAENSRL